MAKRQTSNLITASFHYLVKTVRDEHTGETSDEPISADEYARIVAKIANVGRIDVTDENIIASIKIGENLPFLHHELVDRSVHFGEFEGAYYGQQYRNNRLGIISADSLNLRKFHYLITRLNDGRIVIGVTYNGQFGDYDGIRKCLMHQLRSSSGIVSRSVKSISDELGQGEPVEVKLTFRSAAARPERRGLFGRSGVIAIKATEYGDGFADEVARLAQGVRGSLKQRKAAIANLVNDGDFVELDDDDIIGCSVVVRENKSTRTVYFLGNNNFATKFPLNVRVNGDGHANTEEVKSEVIRVLRERVLPILAG